MKDFILLCARVQNGILKPTRLKRKLYPAWAWGQTFSVRVLKVRLPTGETETLLTSLNQKKLPIRKAAGLYFKRWAVETSYDLLESKLQLEKISGKTEVSVKQDFYATMYIANLASFIFADADEKIAQADEEKIWF